jgi:hypothetical protein
MQTTIHLSTHRTPLIGSSLSALYEEDLEFVGLQAAELSLSWKCIMLLVCFGTTTMGHCNYFHG